MSLATASNGGSAAKKFRYSPEPMFDLNQNQGDNQPAEASQNECAAAETLSFHSTNMNSPSVSPNDSVEAKPDMNKLETGMDNNQADLFRGDPVLSMFLEQASQLFKHTNQDAEKKTASLLPNLNQAPINSNSIRAPIPGALAVAASPAAKLFSEDDWSWHRNPAAAIRSGGTNKQTPVWKYFVYNKAENLSRCIIGDCTYMLKGPHTSTLACHLKKHPAEYSEFQRLKLEYTKERNAGSTMSNSGQGQRNGRSSSNSNVSNGSIPHVQPVQRNRSGSTTPSNINTFLKKSMEQSSLGGIFGAPSLFGNANPPSVSSASSAPKPMSVNEILNNISASAVGLVASASSTSTNSTISAMPFQPDASFPLLNMFKSSEWRRGLNSVPGVPKPNPAAIVQQTRKWPRHDRKQKELEQKLALFFSACQLPTNLVLDPFFRDFVEHLQPRFCVPDDQNSVDQIITQFHGRVLSNMKAQLAVTNKFSLLLNIVRNEPSNLLHLVVSVAFYAQSKQKVDVVLLGVRKLESLEDPVMCLRQTVYQVLTDFDLGTHQVGRTLVSGLGLLGLPDTTAILDAQLVSYRDRLEQTVEEVLSRSELHADLEESVRRVFLSMNSAATATQQLEIICGVSVNPDSLSFDEMSRLLVEFKEPFFSAYLGHSETSQLLHNLDWSSLDCMVRLKNLFRAHMLVVQEESYTTIDRVVPSAMQLLMSLEKDFGQLGDLLDDLMSSIRQKLAYILDAEDEHFDGSFIQATALNPQLVVLLDEQQINYAKKSIEKALLDRIKCAEEAPNRRSGKPGGVDALLAAVVERKSSELCTQSSEASSGFTSALYPDLIEAANQRRKQIKEKTQTGKNHFAEAMVHAYFDEVLAHGTFASIFGTGAEVPKRPLAFWQWGAAKCPQLSEMALDLLSVPSSTVPPESIQNPAFESAVLAAPFAAPPPGPPFQFVKQSARPECVERDALVRFNRAFWLRSPF